MREQHLTIERNIDPTQAVLSPSHFTMCFTHKHDSLLVCKIHVYFDSSAHFNGTILTTVLHSGVVTKDHAPIIISEDQVQFYAQKAQQKLFTLLQMKAQTYLELSRNITEIDKRLSGLSIIRRNTEAYHQAVDLVSDYIRCVEQLERYRDSDLCDDWTHLYRLSDVLKQLDALPTVTVNSPKTDIQSLTQPNEVKTLNQISATPTVPVDLSIQDKLSIQQQLNDILQINLDANLDALIDLNNKLQRIRQDLSLFDLLYNQPDNQQFVMAIRKQLPTQFQDLSSLFCESALQGRLDIVHTLYQQAEIKVNFVELFEQLLRKIEDNSQNGDALVAVADYFYEHSELYKAYVLFRLTHMMICSPVNLGQSDRLSVDMLSVNLLTQMYINNNIKAFSLYLRHGFSPLGCHSWCARTGFNALQTLVLVTHCAHVDDATPYIDLLFQHGAVVDTPRIEFPELYFEINNSTKDLSPARLFDNVLSKNKRAQKLHYEIKSPASGLSSRQANSLSTLSSYANILAFAWPTLQVNRCHVMDAILKRCDLKVCLIELVNIIKQDSFCTSLVPSRHGGCTIYPSFTAYEAMIHDLEEIKGAEDDLYAFSMSLPDANRGDFNMNQFSSQSDLLRLFQSNQHKSIVSSCINKTIQVNIMPSPRYTITVDMQEQLESLRIIYSAFSERYSRLSLSEQKELVNSMRKRAVEAQITDDMIQAASFFKAGIIAISLISPMYLDDYKLLFSLLFQYAKAVDKTNPQPVGSLSVLDAVKTNVHILWTKLSPVIQRGLCETPLMAAIRQTVHQESSGLNCS